MKKEINLYVDDLRDCPDDYVVARNIDEAIDNLENYKVKILSFDHDLREDADGQLLPTEYDLVKLFCERGCHTDRIYIHTDKGAGRENMYLERRPAERLYRSGY